MIKFFILTSLLFIFLILIVALKYYFFRLESLENYKRIKYDDLGEALGWNIYLKEQPINLFLKKKKPSKSYTILAESTYQSVLFLGTIRKFFNLKANFLKTKQYTNYDILQKINNNNFDFALVDESSLWDSIYKSEQRNLIYNTSYNILSNYSNKEDFKNIYYVCSLYSKEFTFICLKDLDIIGSYQISDMKIGVIKGSDDSDRLNIYLKANDNTTCIIKLYNNIDSLFLSLISKEIDILFIVCAHPFPSINKYLKNLDFVILDCASDFTNEKIKYLFPHMRKSSINLKMYNKTDNIKCLSVRSTIISNNKTGKWDVYKFLYNFFNNIDYINNKTKYIFKKNLYYIFIYYINKKFKYHPGAELYYQHKGLISDNSK